MIARGREFRVLSRYSIFNSVHINNESPVNRYTKCIVHALWLWLIMIIIQMAVS